MSPITKDLSDLPRAAREQSGGLKPDRDPTFLAPYLDRLRKRHAAEGERPHAIEGTRFRHSMAGDCARAIGYHALGIERSDPMDLAGMWVTQNGTDKHDEIQEVLDAAHAGPFRAEVPVQIKGFDASGNADGELVRGDEPDTKVVCWEHKNVGGFAFKMAVGERGDAQGPKSAHIIQGALNALGMNADLLVITYLSWEAISVQGAQRKGFSESGRFAAQWTFTRDEWEPIAHTEVARVTGILNLLDDGQLAARKHPDIADPRAVIVDPLKARWEIHQDGRLVDTGSTWACHYCGWQTMCAKTPAGRVPIEQVVEITKAAVA